MPAYTLDAVKKSFFNLLGGAKAVLRPVSLTGPTGSSSSTNGVYWARFGRLMEALQVCTQITTAGPSTYTAEQVLGGIISRDTNGAGRTDVLPTAALLVAATPGVQVNHALRVLVYNSSALTNSITLTAGSGGTLIGSGVVTQNAIAEVLIRFTNVTSGSEAYVAYFGTQTYSGDLSASGNLAVAGNETVGGTLGVTGASTLASVAVTGAATVGTTLGVTGASTLASVGVTGAATVGTTLGVTGASTLTGLLNANGGVTIPTAKTAVVTDADALTVGGLIVPQHFIKTIELPGAEPATAANYGVAHVMREACKIVSVIERHSAAGTDGGAVTAMVKKVPSGTANAAGTDCLAAGIDLKAVADTNQNPALHGTPANYTFAAGDSLGVALTGTPTTVAGLVISVLFQRV